MEPSYIKKIIQKIGCDPNQLFIFRSFKSFSNSFLDDLMVLPFEEKEILRYFTVPMSPGFMFMKRPDLMNNGIDILRECIRDGLLKPFNGITLTMNMDEKKFKFYRDVNYLYPPVSVQLNITNRCINRCQMCRKYKWPQEDLPVDTIKNLVDDLKSFETKLVILSGGEPLLHRSISAVLDMVDDMSTLLITSGTVLLPREGWKRLKRVFFSLDALKHEIYKKIRGIGNINNILKNIELAREAGCEIAITPVIQIDNILHIQEIINFCLKENIPFLPYVVHSYDELAFYDIGGRQIPPFCCTPFYHCLIDPLGDIFVCCHHHQDNGDYNLIDRKYILGNLIDPFKFQSGRTFAEIWFSERAKGIKEYISMYRQPFCSQCYRYLLENDISSSLRKEKNPPHIPYIHTYFFPLSLSARLKIYI